MTVTS